MMSVHPNDRLHSQLNQTSLRDKYAIANREPLLIRSDDAKEIGVKDGDLVRVFNDRGEVLAGVKIYDNLAKNVIVLREGAWYDPLDSAKKSICKNGCANVLTIDKPTSKLANGNISHTALVNIEKYTQKAPKLTAFETPKGV